MEITKDAEQHLSGLNNLSVFTTVKNQRYFGEVFFFTVYCLKKVDEEVKGISIPVSWCEKRGFLESIMNKINVYLIAIHT